MAKRRRRGKKKSTLTIVLFLLCLLLIGGERIGLIDLEASTFTNDNIDGGAYVHFIDVGQGSSTLIQSGTHGVLIDSGLSEYDRTVVDFINSRGVKSLDAVIATHPHSDHIGSLVNVMKEFSVGEVIMPELSEINAPTTRTYEDFLDYIIENEIEAKVVDVKTKTSLSYENESGDYSIDFDLLGPTEQVKDLNNMSVVCRATVAGNTFMLLGDAEAMELSSILELGFVNKSLLKSDVLLMGHHGSSTSVYKPFLNKVDADIAVISAGKDNSYGHPHREALNYCKNNNMKIYRTDIDGTISFKCTESGLQEVNS